MVSDFSQSASQPDFRSHGEVNGSDASLHTKNSALKFSSLFGFASQFRFFSVLFNDRAELRLSSSTAGDEFCLQLNWKTIINANTNVFQNLSISVSGSFTSSLQSRQIFCLFVCLCICAAVVFSFFHFLFRLFIFERHIDAMKTGHFVVKWPLFRHLFRRQSFIHCLVLWIGCHSLMMMMNTMMIYANSVVSFLSRSIKMRRKIMSASIRSQFNIFNDILGNYASFFTHS